MSQGHDQYQSDKARPAQDTAGFPASTDQSLLRRAVNGDDGAWSLLVELYAPPIYGICRRRGLDATTSEDLVQVALTKVWKALPRFERDPDSEVTVSAAPGITRSSKANVKHDSSRPRKRFKYWLRVILRNAIIDYQRKMAARHEQGPLGGHAGVAMIQNIACDIESAETFSVADNAYVMALREVLEKIRKRKADAEKGEHWDAFVLVVLKGHSYAEAARETGLTEGNVRVVVHRIKREIEEILGELF